eukprot:SAG11_NODE_10892_length_798_cov_5.416309_1_plen_57_part_01
MSNSIKHGPEAPHGLCDSSGVCSPAQVVEMHVADDSAKLGVIFGAVRKTKPIKQNTG